MDFGCEIDPNAPLTPFERACVGILALFTMGCVAACLGAIP